MLALTFVILNDLTWRRISRILNKSTHERQRSAVEAPRITHRPNDQASVYEPKIPPAQSRPRKNGTEKTKSNPLASHLSRHLNDCEYLRLQPTRQSARLELSSGERKEPGQQKNKRHLCVVFENLLRTRVREIDH
jgi:hypothetical protein